MYVDQKHWIFLNVLHVRGFKRKILIKIIIVLKIIYLKYCNIDLFYTTMHLWL